MRTFGRWIKLTVAGFSRNHCALHAAGLTYFSMLALVPLLCVLLVLAKAAGIDDLARGSINAYLDSLIVNVEHGQEEDLFSGLPVVETDRGKKRIAASVFAREARNVSNAVFERIESFNIGTFGWIGFFFLFWTVVSSVGMIEVSFNEIWDVDRPRPPLKRALVHPAIALALPPAAVLAVSPQLLNFVKDVLEMTLGSAWVTKWISDWLVTLVDRKVFRMAFSFGMSSLAFAAFFKVMPNRVVAFPHALAGGAATSLLFSGWLKLCAVAQVGIAKSSALYGSFAFFPIVLTWMYVSWEIALFGANMVRAMEIVSSGQRRKPS